MQPGGKKQKVAGGWLLASLIAASGASCLVFPDASKYKNRDAYVDFHDDLAPDTVPPDLEEPSDSPPAERRWCSPDGVLSLCDPVNVKGCYEGTCYLIPFRGVSCVCPVGTAAEGEACNTTVECAPGHVCAGTSPPGTCRRTCDSNTPDCPTGLQCTPINGFPQYGYCEP